MSTGADNARWVFPRRQVSEPERPVRYGPGVDGWQHTELWIAELDPGESFGGALTDLEVVVVPLVGGCVVERRVADDVQAIELAGRPHVFAGPTDVAYLPAGPGAGYAVRGTGPERCRVAVCGARASGTRSDLTARHLRAAEVSVELRGAGMCSREVRNFATPDVLDAEAIIACEVLTPAGGWSSYPPHKHDEDRPGEESELEEIYYVETRAVGSAKPPRLAGAAPGAGGAPTPDPVAYQRVYGTPERPIDVLAEVRTGDVVLVPHGWHGPSIAAPDADLYYLNVMAGPGAQRVWQICFDPAHDAARASWDDQPVDQRLPFGGGPAAVGGY